MNLILAVFLTWVTVRPRRFAGVALEELTLGAALG